MKIETEETWAVYRDGSRELIDLTTHELPESEADAEEIAARNRWHHGRRWDMERKAEVLQAARHRGGKASKYVRAIQAVVDKLVARDPAATVADLWERLPVDAFEPVYRDLEEGRLCAGDEEGREVSIARSTFPAYVKRARRSSKKR